MHIFLDINIKFAYIVTLYCMVKTTTSFLYIKNKLESKIVLALTKN